MNETHSCATPSEGNPGDTFDCPCGISWWASDVDSSHGNYIEWVENE